MMVCSNGCNGSGTVLVEKIPSVLYHISNIHQWNDNGQWTDKKM